jgi:hypothetical protein
MANKYMQKCLTSLSIKEIQIQTTLRFYFIQVRRSIMKKTTINAGEDSGKKEPVYTVDGNIN